MANVKPEMLLPELFQGDYSTDEVMVDVVQDESDLTANEAQKINRMAEQSRDIDPKLSLFILGLLDDPEHARILLSRMGGIP